MNLRTTLLDLLFPPRCPFCSRLLEENEALLCARCQRELPWTQGVEGERTGEFFALCAAPLWYRDQVRESLQRYKFSGRRGYAESYGVLLAQCVTDHLAGRYDLVTWAPLSRKRLRKRGYDQARLLAERLAGNLGTRAVPLLDKVRDIPAQSGLEEESARRANVLGAYEMRPGVQVSGQRVLLVDDIVTTGSTLSECARVLRTAGAAEVVCVAVAQAREGK